MDPEAGALERAFEEFLAHRARGEVLDPADFVARHAHMGPELALAIEALLVLEGATGPGFDAGALPDRIGPYRVQRELGRGGMGVVFEAIEEPLGRRVALKVLPAELLGSASARARFRREAELAARLDHSGIATIYGASVEEAHPWIAMRFVEGQTLARAIALARAERRTCASIPGATERDPQVAVARCVARVAEALQAAHEQGVVHRDVKPSNVVVSPDGSPVLLDFGLAVREDAEGPALTRTGDTAGTPAYLAPEHVTGERARPDAQSDVYSLGVALYECLTLRRPFEAPTHVALYGAIASGSATGVRTLNRQVARDLAVIVTTAMERDRSRRYATARAFARDLEAFVEGRPIAARPVPLAGKVLRWARREPRQAVLGGLLLAAMLVVALFGGTWWASRDEVFAAERMVRERERDQLLAAGYVKLQEDRDADPDFLRALELDPGNLEAIAGRSLVELGRRRNAQALQLLSAAPATPGFEALRSLCRGERVAQDFEAGFAVGASALDLFLVGTSLSRQADRGPLSQREPDQRRALALLEEAVLRSPTARPLLHAARAIAAADARDESAARSAVQALLVLWPDSPQPVFVAGLALYRFDRDAAEPILERATRLAPHDPAPCQVLGNLHQHRGDSEAAEHWLWRALARRQDAETYNSLGISLIQRGCVEEAREAWHRGLALDPLHQNSWMNLGQSHYGASDYERARFYLERSLERDPEDAHAHGIIGMASRRAGDLPEARNHLERALELDPQRSGFWVELIAVDLELGDESAARLALETGLEHAPGDPELAQVRASQGWDR